MSEAGPVSTAERHGDLFSVRTEDRTEDGATGTTMTIEAKSSPFHKEMQTCVASVLYDWEIRSGTVVVDSDCCVDMTGTIAFFQRIDPQVRRIFTFAGADGETRERDVAYVKVDDEWLAIEPRAWRGLHVELVH
jgi:hypothetical protein